MFKKKFKFAMEYMQLGHAYFDLKEYREAIKYYKEALSELEWILPEIKLLKFHKRYFKAINFFQSTWGWLGKAHRELGEEQEAIECSEQQRRYSELQELYLQKYTEKVQEIKREKKKTIHMFLFIAAIEGVTYTIGIIMGFFLKPFIFFINSIIFLGYFIVYLILISKIRNLFEPREEYKDKSIIFLAGSRRLSRKWSRESVVDQQWAEFCYKNIFIFINLFITILFGVYFTIPLDNRLEVFVIHAIIIISDFLFLLLEFAVYTEHTSYQKKNILKNEEEEFIQR